MEKAPAEVVEGEREKLDGYRRALESLGSMTFREAEDYLLGLELFGMKFGLERMHKLMTALGLPQRRFASIHVVGSNGKSSTVRFIAAILERHGLRTGSYTSPHLALLPRADRGGGGAGVRGALRGGRWSARSALVDDVTQFEAMTAAAYHELAAREVEVAVIEAGLGGRYDATNVIPSKVAVLTGVGLEHTRWLGPTIADIAAGEARRGARPRHAGGPVGPAIPMRWRWPSAVALGAPRPAGHGAGARAARSSGATSPSPTWRPRSSWAARPTPARSSRRSGRPASPGASTWWAKRRS